MASLKLAATLRPVSYARRMTFTVARRPVRVEVFRIRRTAVSSASNSIPWQARPTCAKKRRSMGLNFEQ